MGRRWLSIAVILIAAPGCDNVAWGGTTFTLRKPLPRAELASSPAPETAEGDTVATPVEPPPNMLFAGVRQGPRARLVAVARLDAGGLAPLSGVDPPAPAEGSELVLFSEGVRVGSLSVDSVVPDAGYCVARPTVSGVIELTPSAQGATSLLALPEELARDRAYGDFEPLAHDYDQRVASLALARAALPTVGATWPPSVLAARKDIQVFRLDGTGEPSIAATFLYGDTLAVAPPLRGGYSIFLIGTPATTGYRTEYLAYRPADTEGKGAPRYFGHMDWDGDGSDEILLEVIGPDRRWFAGLDRRAGSWARVFEDPCGAASTGR